MKKLVIVTLAVGVMGLNGIAMADGFKCETRDGKLLVKVFNQVKPELGTRNAAVMVISDRDVHVGRKTIASFKDASGLLSSRGANYVAKVDLRFADSRRKGELIGGTKLGELDRILLGVDFNYSQPVEEGEIVSGVLTLEKRNGDSIELDMDCTRYLKN
ncbi:MAG: hypothetical protein HY843_03610 [Bdellovibrio sp.]|nr:hypothetical protein [Bdellovibrio sp.]